MVNLPADIGAGEYVGASFGDQRFFAFAGRARCAGSGIMEADIGYMACATDARAKD